MLAGAQLRPTPLSRRRSPLPTLETEAIAATYPLILTYQDAKRFGRPTSLTPDLIDRLADLVAEGHYVSTCRDALGVPHRTFYHWTERGQADEKAGLDSPELDFWHTLKRAEAWGAIELIRDAKTGRKGWEAPMTVASRRYRDLWHDASPDRNVPQVIVQIGVQAQDVSVSFASPQVNVIDTYQTHSLSEGQHAQGLPAPQCSASEAKEEGRKSTQTLPMPGRGHGLTGPPPVDVGVSPDGSGVLKAIRRRGPGKKKGPA